ncbi:hypothetical protein BH10BAC3_BH10BAC3_31310 [soil metagenome]
MIQLLLRKALLVLLFFTIAGARLQAQFLMDMIDTSKDIGRGMLGVYKKYDHLRISGYMQPQFQLASDTGINSYSGGNFPTNSNNRFMFRRGRVRFDYARYTKENFPSVQFVFQFDGTERGVFIRDFWGRVWENKWHLFAFTTGMFARPFGYEVNLSSGDREAPERGRMSQILMKTERDLGAMISFEPQQKSSPLHNLKIDAGLFNGQGLTWINDFDRYKDFIGQVYWKPTEVAHHLFLSGGVSYLNGGIRQPGRYRYYTTEGTGGSTKETADSTHATGSKMPRKYAGINTQLKLKHGWGATELRAEYWQGTQTGTQSSSETPAPLANGENLYVRKFNGAFICLLQNIANDKNQLILKYDIYDPNTAVKDLAIGSTGTNFSAADIKFSTLGFGVLRHINENLKVVFYYDLVHNEATSLKAYTSDISDNVLTCRLQFRF